MKTHITVEGGRPAVEGLASEITAYFRQVGDMEMERVLLFDLDFDLVETVKVYTDGETIIKISHNHQED